jgi:predicted O-methyltransferase YrrM
MSAADHSPNVAVGWYNESQFSPARPAVPHPERFHTRDIQATEDEVIEMVHGIIRGIQPTWCVETGTSRGFLAKRIGDALAINGGGTLVTYESEEETWLEAQDQVGTYPQIISLNEPSMRPWEHGPIDFAWFDSLLELRWREFDFYAPHMSTGAIVCFHDCAPRFGPWSDQVRHDPRIRVIDMPTPRGMLMGRLVQ